MTTTKTAAATDNTDAIKQLGHSCAREAWKVCSPDMRGELSGSAAGEEKGSIDALSDLIGRVATAHEWRLFMNAYDAELAEMMERLRPPRMGWRA